MKAFDIDPTPAPRYTLQCRYICFGHLQAIQYGGWTDHTYRHVLPVGRAAAKVDVTLRTIQQLDRVLCNIELQTAECRRGVPQGFPLTTTTDVQICTWNCRVEVLTKVTLKLLRLIVLHGETDLDLPIADTDTMNPNFVLRCPSTNPATRATPAATRTPSSTRGSERLSEGSLCAGVRQQGGGAIFCLSHLGFSLSNELRVFLQRRQA
ncbi:hypothetical protein Cgig2_013229 [Carnegiea gigantea]|uniref:Uncharacterized protein n=1 Tax=Carnegiea gigantea TaxID=171969 RepID=A0A9Q1GNH7_9CARY|nr:hypothetical protein Cgig2_013229 [Carnegiea gigantea]